MSQSFVHIFHTKVIITLILVFLIAPVFVETVITVYRAVTAWLERDFRIGAAAGTDCRMHFARGTVSPVTKAASVSLLAGRSALGTAAGLVGKAPFSIELLLGSCKFKIRATFTAGQGFVLIHEDILLNFSLLNGDSLIFDLHHH